jgi:arylsulfatase A-like enzyme
MNAVVVCLDSLRKDHVGVYGNDWIQTPNLDALAGRSMRFTRAYPESMHTICLRRSLYTGIRTWPFWGWDPIPEEVNYTAGWQPMPEDQVSVTETLAENGYRTALITDNWHLFKPGYNFQRGFDVFDFIRGQESDKYRSGLAISEEAVERNTVPGNGQILIDKVRQYLANTAGRDGEEDYFAPKVFSRAMGYLDTVAENGGEPFFMVVDCFDPHEPWDPPQRYIDLYSNGYEGREPMVPNYDTTDYLTERQLERMRNLYAAEVTMTDEWFGRFVNRMDDLGMMEDTLLFVFSDHGMALGEHGYTGKPVDYLWPQMTDLVYFVHHPQGLGAGQTSDFYASNHDVAPTILATLGIEQEKPMEGQDLTPVLEGGEPEEERRHFTFGCDEYSWTRDEDYAMFCVNDLSSPQLYDLREDPEMEDDVAGENPDVVRRMYEDYIVADAGGVPPLREEATEPSPARD